MKKNLLLSLSVFICIQFAAIAQQINPQQQQGVHYAKTLVSGQCSCLIPLDTTFSIVPFTGNDNCNECPGYPPQYRNDDSFTDPPVSLPFNFCFYGQTYSQVYINNNGNISFGTENSDYTSVPFPNVDYSIIAPFWGDVDTDNPASGLVYYKLTNTALIVKWDSVGYYDSNADKLNTFQLIITNGTDPLLPNGNNVSFCYGEMQWTAGDESDGTDGLGGDPATVGLNVGDGINYLQVGTFDTSGTAYYGPYGNPGGVEWLDNQQILFNACLGGTNIPPMASNVGACDTIRMCINDTLNVPVNFISPENGQTTTIVDSISPGLLGWTVTVDSSGNPAVVNGQLIAQLPNTGAYTLTFTGTDNGIPPESTTVSIIVYIDTSCVAGLPPIANFTATPVSICANDCINFTDLSRNANSWQWIFYGGTPSVSTDENPQNICYRNTGMYDVSLVATNAYGSDPIIFNNYITVSTSPPTPNITEDGDTLFCSTDSSYKSYQWYMDTMLIPNATNSFLIISTGGNYNVQVSNETGCKVAVGTNIILGLDNLVRANAIYLSPNPAGDRFTVYGLRFAISAMGIYNMLGEKVISDQQEIKNDTSNPVIDVHSLSPGIYFVEIVGNKEKWMGRFVKE